VWTHLSFEIMCLTQNHVQDYRKLWSCFKEKKLVSQACGIV
jgi:hypothetical protein